MGTAFDVGVDEVTSVSFGAPFSTTEPQV